MFKFFKKKENVKESKIKAIISYAIGMIALVLCIYIVSSVIAATTEKRPPRIFGLSVSYVPTGSMEPTYYKGDGTKLSSATLYQAGSTVPDTYYTKS